MPWALATCAMTGFKVAVARTATETVKRSDAAGSASAICGSFSPLLKELLLKDPLLALNGDCDRPFPPPPPLLQNSWTCLRGMRIMRFGRRIGRRLEGLCEGC